jgi:signal transduction histidine kinase
VRPRGPRIQWLLLGANAFVLATPVLAVVGLRLYETYLVRQTERQLIAQSVVIAEAWRDAWLAERDPSAAPRTDREPPPFRPPARATEAFIPVEPVLDLRAGVAPPQPTELPAVGPVDSPERRAGARIEPLLHRMQVFNLSAARILDARGCVVATSRGEKDHCMSALPEVAAALAGHYAALARERISDEPLPPISDVRSRGSIRIFTALPVFSDGKVVAVVRMSRTSLDALTSLWYARRGLVLTLGGTLLVAVAVSLLCAALVVRPVRAITRRAEAVSRGAQYQPMRPSAWTPEEIRLLGDALERMTARLRGRAEYVAEFAANASHELKTPVTAIRGAAELLREQWSGMDEPQRRRFIDNIDADAARMEHLVSRLLELARIESAPAATETVDVSDFFSALAARYGEPLALEVRDPPARIVIDRDHLASAVVNLVENALRHGAGHPVHVRVGAEGDRLCVVVRDRGAGISAANQRRLFQRFFTTERDRGGTGLGLAIVRAVAEGRGGSIRFASGPDGTSFTLVV